MFIHPTRYITKDIQMPASVGIGPLCDHMTPDAQSRAPLHRSRMRERTHPFAIGWTAFCNAGVQHFYDDVTRGNRVFLFFILLRKKIKA